jgi:pimeloyl-ACP methyl ester carboxylesterase
MTTPGLSAPVDGFRLSYDDVGSGPVVVLLHGWPGDRTDYRRVVPLLADSARLLVPDLRGFGASDKHAEPPATSYSPQAQARSVLGLLDELGIDSATLVGYDVGSRVAQTLAGSAPQRVRRLVVAPPLPGAGERLLVPDVLSEFWYQQFHRLPVADDLIDGNPDAVRAYLSHIWRRWSGPGAFEHVADLDHLVQVYGSSGAFTASIAWYRAGAGSVERAKTERAPARAERLDVPVDVLWPHHDPLFPLAWSDRLDEWFSDVTLSEAPDAGHFVPLEAPDLLADLVRRSLRG